MNDLGTGIKNLVDESAVDNEVALKGKARFGNQADIDNFPGVAEKLKAHGYDVDSVTNSDQAFDLWQSLFKDWNSKYPDNTSWGAEKANKIWNDEKYAEKSDLLEKLADYWYAKEWEQKAPYGRYGDGQTAPFKRVDK